MELETAGYFAFLVPAAAVTRWLLIVDLVCLLAIGLTMSRPLVACPVALGSGFLLINILGMVTLDYFVGLALFHLAVGLVTLATVRRARWLGATSLALAALLGIVT